MMAVTHHNVPLVLIGLVHVGPTTCGAKLGLEPGCTLSDEDLKMLEQRCQQPAASRRTGGVVNVTLK